MCRYYSLGIDFPLDNNHEVYILMGLCPRLNGRELRVRGETGRDAAVGGVLGVKERRCAY